MIEMTWKVDSWCNAFLGCKSLKTIRKEHDLEIPEWYNKTVFRFAVALSFQGIFLGFMFCLGLIILIGKYFL